MRVLAMIMAGGAVLLLTISSLVPRGLPRWFATVWTAGIGVAIIARFGTFGKILRTILQLLEKTPLKVFGLSHFWVVEKI